MCSTLLYQLNEATCLSKRNQAIIYESVLTKVVNHLLYFAPWRALLIWALVCSTNCSYSSTLILLNGPSVWSSLLRPIPGKIFYLDAVALEWDVAPRRSSDDARLQLVVDSGKLVAGEPRPEFLRIMVGHCLLVLIDPRPQVLLAPVEVVNLVPMLYNFFFLVTVAAEKPDFFCLWKALCSLV